MHLLESKVLNAIRQSQYKQLALYIRHDYNLNVTTKDGHNGLFYALDIPDSRKRRRMIRFCLDHGINALQRDQKNNYTPLHEAIARQQLDSVQLLIANIGGEIDWRAWDSQGRTILHQAVESNNPAILEALVIVMNHYGVSVDIPDKHGLTPYLLATKLHLRDMVEVLVNKGHASRQQRDLSTYRNAEEWEIAGIEENRAFLLDQLRREIETAKTEGKINKVKKLKEVYKSSLLLSSTTTSEPVRRDSFLSMTSISGCYPKSTLSINEIIEHLVDGDIPESYVHSQRDEETFHLESLYSPTQTLPLSLPPISTGKQYRSNMTLNNIVDLFQLVADQDSSSYRSPVVNEIPTTVDQSKRKRISKPSHRSTLAMIIKTHPTILSSTSRQQRSSNTSVSTKNTA